VLYGHTIAHLNITPIPWFTQFINFFQGVPIFFALSGFLIWNSISKSKTFKDYAKKRFLRIYPELWMAVLIEIIAILIFYAGRIDIKWLTLFAFTQGSIFQFWTPNDLRGYGCGTPNGALWTIGVLIQYYVVAYFLFKFLHDRKTKVWICAMLFSMLFSFCVRYLNGVVPTVALKLVNQTVFPYLWMFIFPSFLAEHRTKILPFLAKYWYAFFLLALFEFFISVDIKLEYCFFRTISLCLFVIGFSYAFPSLNIKKDLSYGIYIYHMTVVNALIALGFTQTIGALITVIVLTFVVAYISTITIGNIVQKKKLELVAK
jgi:peptidoglycan/LPS O-acetylase OafA/YrhL